MVETLTWDFSRVPCAGVRHELTAAAILGPRAISSVQSVMDVSGGGFWTLTLVDVQLYAVETIHRTYLHYRNKTAGGVGKIVVPLICDLISPTHYSGIPWSDGTYGSGGGGHEASSVIAELAEDAALGAGTISLLIRSGRAPQLADMFSLYGETRGWRLHAVTAIDATTTTPDGSVVTIGITPPLREALTAATVADFYRPRCQMRLPAGACMPWEPRGYWVAKPTVTFVEDMSPA